MKYNCRISVFSTIIAIDNLVAFYQFVNTHSTHIKKVAAHQNSKGRVNGKYLFFVASR